MSGAAHTNYARYRTISISQTRDTIFNVFLLFNLPLLVRALLFLPQSHDDKTQTILRIQQVLAYNLSFKMIQHSPAISKMIILKTHFPLSLSTIQTLGYCGALSCEPNFPIHS